jgi:hypothetical protein
MIFWTDAFDPQVTFCMNYILVFDSFGKKTPEIVRSYSFECDFKNVLVDRVGTNRKFEIRHNKISDVISKRLFQEGFGSIVAFQPLRENDGWCSADQRRGLFFVVTRGKGELIEKTNEGCQLSRTG